MPPLLPKIKRTGLRFQSFLLFIDYLQFPALLKMSGPNLCVLKAMYFES